GNVLLGPTRETHRQHRNIGERVFARPCLQYRGTQQIALRNDDVWLEGAGRFHGIGDSNDRLALRAGFAEDSAEVLTQIFMSADTKHSHDSIYPTKPVPFDCDRHHQTQPISSSASCNAFAEAGLASRSRDIA